MTVLVVAMAVFVWGFAQWPRRLRLWWRVFCVACLALALVVTAFWARGYVERFIGYWKGGGEDDGTISGRIEKLARVWRTSSRGRMYGGALRAWSTSPIWGIGPGMHQNLWPHFAATQDGDREGGVWPSMPNYDFHSYEVHSDWLQLLEEYGIIGFILFTGGVAIGFGCLFKGLCSETALWRNTQWRGPGSDCFDIMLAGLLAAVAMAFHSLGDFNLQIPANTWLLTTAVACGIGGTCTVAVRLRDRSQSAGKC